MIAIIGVAQASALTSCGRGVPWVIGSDT